MANHDEKRSNDLLNLTGGGEGVVWTTLESWTIPAYMRSKLKHGPNWIGDNFFQHDATTGISISLVASPSAPRADYEVQGRIAIAEALAAHSNPARS
jgi:hypothetical protein